jgi:hypothetical protein
VFSLKVSDSDSPNTSDPCSGRVWRVRPTQAGDDGGRLVPGSKTFCCSSSCKLRSPNLLAMKWRDPKTNPEPGKNFADA